MRCIAGAVFHSCDEGSFGSRSSENKISSSAGYGPIPHRLDLRLCCCLRAVALRVLIHIFEELNDSLAVLTIFHYYVTFQTSSAHVACVLLALISFVVSRKLRKRVQGGPFPAASQASKLETVIHKLPIHMKHQTMTGSV